MEWTKLELRKAAVLRKEVDLAIRRVTAAVENDNQELVEELMESIQYRIDQIEEFYAQNDNDDRAILFEKQRLRLRRTLQNLAPPPTNETESSPHPDNVVVPMNASPEKTQKNKIDPISRQQKYSLRSNSGSPSRSAFYSTVSSPLSSKPLDNNQNSKMDIGELGNDSVDERDDASGTCSQISTQYKKAVKRKSKLPTYEWQSIGEENHSDNKLRTSQERIFTAEYGSFIPSTTPGLYMAEEGTDETSSVGTNEVSDHLNMEKSFCDYPSTHLDIQIVLTPAEFEAYVLRKRNVTKKSSDSKNAIVAKTAKDNSKFCNYLTNQSQFLSTQTPYMDPKRIKWDLCRPKQVDKWIDPKGFL